jgi:AraC family transcriptional activator of mar-sox-rob regulon
MCYLSRCEKTRFGQGFKCNNKTCNYCKNAPPLNATNKDTFRQAAWGNQMNTGAFMHDLLDWIDNNLDSRLDIESVARRSGYSKWHLQRLFKEHTGYPLAGYIRAQKLQKSVERLTRSDEPILNVAIALGFDSQQSFNRSFKRQYGQAPGAWRRSIGGPDSATATPVIQVVRVITRHRRKCPFVCWQ